MVFGEAIEWCRTRCVDRKFFVWTMVTRTARLFCLEQRVDIYAGRKTLVRYVWLYVQLANVR